MEYLIYDMRSEAVSGIGLLAPSELDATEQAAYAARGEGYLRERTILRQEKGER